MTLIFTIDDLVLQGMERPRVRVTPPGRHGEAGGGLRGARPGRPALAPHGSTRVVAQKAARGPCPLPEGPPGPRPVSGGCWGFLEPLAEIGRAHV